MTLQGTYVSLSALNRVLLLLLYCPYFTGKHYIGESPGMGTEVVREVNSDQERGGVLLELSEAIKAIPLHSCGHSH